MMKILFVLLLVAICLARPRPGFSSRFLSEKTAKKDAAAPMGCNLDPSERGFIKCYPSADPSYEIACNQTTGACNRIYVNGAVPEITKKSESKRSVNGAPIARSYQVERGEALNLIENGGFEYPGFLPFETFEHWFSWVYGNAEWKLDKGHTHIGHGIKTPKPPGGGHQAAVVHQDSQWFAFLAQAFKLNANGDCDVELDLSFKLDLQNFGATWSFSDLYLDADLFLGPVAGQFFSVSIGNGDAAFAQTVYATQFGQKNIPTGYHNYRFKLDNAAFLHEHVHDNWFYIEFDISSTTGRILIALDDVQLSARCVGGERPHHPEPSDEPSGPPPHGPSGPHPHGPHRDNEDDEDKRK